jgi:subtilase family serine protease
MKRLRCGFVAVVVAVLFSAFANALGPFEPDLQIQSMSAPASAVAGAEIQVAVRFINRGVGGAGSFMAELWLEEQVVGRPPLATARWSVRNLSPGDDVLERRVLRVPAILAAGAYSLRVFADRDLRLTESDESNNVAVRAIQVTAASPGSTSPPSVPAGPGTMVAPPRDLRTDLAVESMTPSATSALPGERITVQARVANRGNVTTVASSASLLLRPRTGSAQVLQTVSVPRLSGGAAHALFFSSGLAATLAPGTYTLAVKVDPDNAFAESDEGNNEATVELTVAGPDLEGCGALRVTPGSVRPGGGIAITACIHNIGTAESPTVPYRIVLSASRTLDSPRVLRQSAGGTPLAPRNTMSINLNGVTVPADLAPATYYLGVLVDPDGRVAETNERNNTIGPLALVVAP